MCRVKEIKMMVGLPAFEASNINPEVKQDYKILITEIDCLEKELGRRDRIIALYKEALGGSIALREDQKAPEPEKADGLLKRLKK